jgi:hypothetical protein
MLRFKSFWDCSRVGYVLCTKNFFRVSFKMTLCQSWLSVFFSLRALTFAHSCFLFFALPVSFPLQNICIYTHSYTPTHQTPPHTHSYFFHTHHTVPDSPFQAIKGRKQPGRASQNRTGKELDRQKRTGRTGQREKKELPREDCKDRR